MIKFKVFCSHTLSQHSARSSDNAMRNEKLKNVIKLGEKCTTVFSAGNMIVSVVMLKKIKSN